MDSTFTQVSAHVCAAAFNATSLNEVASQVQGAALVHKAGAGTVEVSTFTHEEGVLFKKWREQSHSSKDRHLFTKTAKKLIRN